MEFGLVVIFGQLLFMILPFFAALFLQFLEFEFSLRMVCHAPHLIRIKLQVVRMNQAHLPQVHWSSSVASASPLFSSSSASVSRSTTRTLSESSAQSSRTRWETWTWPSPAWSSSPWCSTQPATTCTFPGNCCFQGKEWWKLQWKIVSCIMSDISWLQ